MRSLRKRGSEPLSSRPDNEEPRSAFLPIGVFCGRYWVRTSDLLGVNEALYH